MNTNINLDHKTCGQLLRLSDNAITVYIALKSLYNRQMEQQLLSLQSIIYQLDKDIINKKKTNYKSVFKSFEDGIEELEKAEFIEIINRNKDFYEINMQGLFVEDVTKQIDEADGNKRNVSYFTTFDISLFSDLYRDNRRKEIFRFLFYYLSSKHNNNNFFYFMKTREEMASDINLDIRTVDKYIELLEEYGVIYVFRNPYKWKNSNKQLSNLYGLSEDESDIERFGYTYIHDNIKDIYESVIPKIDKTPVPVNTPSNDLDIIEPIVKEVTQSIIIEEKPKGYVVDLDAHRRLEEQIKKKKEQDLYEEYYSEPIIEESKWMPKGNPFA